MNFKKSIQALQDHVKEEIRIHKEVMQEVKGDAKHLIKKHLADTKVIHVKFWKDLKKSWNNK